MISVGNVRTMLSSVWGCAVRLLTETGSQPDDMVWKRLFRSRLLLLSKDVMVMGEQVVKS
jgi:hypothetical protein